VMASREKEASNAKPSLYSRISQIVFMRKRRHAGSVTHAAGRHPSPRARPAGTIRRYGAHTLPLSNAEQREGG
jgi:hypothetical protein